MAHSRRTADDEDQDYQERGHNDDDEEVLLQEVHYSAEDEVFEADYGGGDGVGEAGRLSDYRHIDRLSGGEGRWEEEPQLGFIAAAVHGDVVEERTGVAAQTQQGHRGHSEKQGGTHL